MTQVQFVITKGGIHGGMMFRASVAVYRHSYTSLHPDRYEFWFRRPTEAEARSELDKRCKQGWELTNTFSNDSNGFSGAADPRTYGVDTPELYGD